MPPITQSCATSGQQFTITEAEQAFYKQMGLDLPRHAPQIRQKKRIVWRNFTKLYHGKCDLTGKSIITSFHPNTKQTVYSPTAWYSDDWDASEYAIDFDPNKDFFQQWQELSKKVPRLSVLQNNCENCDYTNLSADSRNCYMVYGCIINENCYYGHIVWNSENCLDSLYCRSMQWCYECTDCINCYQLFFSKDCSNCSDSSYLEHCKSCESCTGCYGLVRKKWYVLNKQYNSVETYEQAKESFLNLTETEKIAAILELKKITPIPYRTVVNSENVSLNYIYNSKNLHHCFDTGDCEDCANCYTFQSGKDCYDYSYTGIPNELCYNGSFTRGQNLICSLTSWNCSDSAYLQECLNLKDCLGCIGLKNKQFCILNKQYSETEYQQIRQQIIDQLKKQNKWGEFFPEEYSPYPYNDTMAQEYFPLTEEKAKTEGIYWESEIDRGFYDGPIVETPEDITKVDESITKQILLCAETKTPYRIFPKELSFYQRFKLPIPKLAPQTRHQKRMAKRNPRLFWKRQCHKCQKEIFTTFSPERPELIYCEECYLNEKY